MPNKRPLEDRFWDKVAFGMDCWGWFGAVDKNGYGQTYAHGKQLKAHRVSYEMHYGKIPDGLMVLHKCDNPGCTRPCHLFVGSNSDNMKDMASKGRGGKSRGESHGMSKLTPSNVGDIRSMVASGISQREASRRFGVSYQNVWRIVHSETWQ